MNPSDPPKTDPPKPRMLTRGKSEPQPWVCEPDSKLLEYAPKKQAMRYFSLFLLVVSLLPNALAQDGKPSDSGDPIPFGMLSQYMGCVIFREFRKTSGMFWGVAVTTKTVSKLEIIETQDYKPDRKLWDETQMDDMNEL